MNEREFQRILLIKPSSLGDIVHALPVLRGLRHRYPNAVIHWLVNDSFAALLEGHPDIDELVVFDRRRFSRVGRSWRVTREFMAFVTQIRNRRYDLVVDLQGLFRTGFLAWASGAPVRIGFREAREGAWLFYNRRLPRAEGDVHAVDRNYAVAGVLGFSDLPVSFGLHLADDDRRSVEGLLSEHGHTNQQPLVAIVPGARWETKMWHPQRFAATIDALEQADHVRCVLLGGPDEEPLCRRITEDCRTTPINLAGRTSIRQLAAVIATVDAVVCQDSAAMHLAVAFGKPLVCLVGPTNPHRTGPYGRLDDVMRSGPDCAPCYLRDLSQCGHDHRCMTEISADSVVSAVRRLLEKAPTCG